MIELITFFQFFIRLFTVCYIFFISFSSSDSAVPSMETDTTSSQGRVLCFCQMHTPWELSSRTPNHPSQTSARTSRDPWRPCSATEMHCKWAEIVEIEAEVRILG